MPPELLSPIGFIRLKPILSAASGVNPPAYRIKSKTECASEQKSNDAAVKDAQKGPSKEGFALRMMEQSTNYAAAWDAQIVSNERSVQDARGVSQPS